MRNTDVKSFNVDQLRDPAMIARAILHYPLNRGLAKRDVQEEHDTFGDALKRLLRDANDHHQIDDPHSDVDAEDHPSNIIAGSVVNYERLQEALERLQERQPLSSIQQLVLKRAPELIELMACECDAFAKARQKEADAEAERPVWEREDDADWWKGESDKPTIATYSKMLQASAENLRIGVVPLFKALAQALEQGQQQGR